MAKEQIATREQVEEEMRQLRKVFSSVRLIPAENVQGRKGRRPCYAHWKRDRPCENCVARRVLLEKSRKSKLEYMGRNLYEVTASYIEVDGKPCVLELSQKMDRSLLLGPNDSERFITAITSERERAYRDQSTGAYNRQYYNENYHGRAMTAGIVMLDLDDMMLATDVYGRRAGEAVLETAVNVIRRSLEEKDRIIRFDGDMLLLLLPDIGQEDFSQKLEQIRLQLNTTSVPGRSYLRMSASIGGVWVENADLDDGVERAEQLMNYARIQKNRTMVEQQPQQAAAVLPHCRQSALIVDDSSINRMILCQMLGDQFDTAQAGSGEECMRLLEGNPTGVSVVLLDIYMPGMDGFEVLEAMNKRELLDDIPVIVVSTEDAKSAMHRALLLGAADYIVRPFDTDVVYQRVVNTIHMRAKHRRLSAMVAGQVYATEKRSEMMTAILSRAMERLGGESRDHARHIRILTQMLLAQLVRADDAYPLTREQCQIIGMAAVLHDIGKMELADLRPNGCDAGTPEDAARMQQHTLLGAQMMEELEAYRDEYFVQTAYQICRWHHERYDGSGYPDGLSGEQIPLAAQVVGLADAYETLVCSSPEVPCGTAVKMLCEGACGAFSPVLLDCLQKIAPEIDEALRDPREAP